MIVMKGRKREKERERERERKREKSDQQIITQDFWEEQHTGCIEQYHVEAPVEFCGERIYKVREREGEAPTSSPYH